MSQNNDGDVISEALRIVAEGSSSGIDIRLIGSVAVVVLTGVDPSSRPVKIKDVDLMSRVRSRSAVQRLLLSRGWELAHEFLLFSEIRETYYSVSRPFSLDVYYEEVDGNHRINIGDRLTLYYPTITPIDLLFTKIQRVRLRPQDEWDACALLRRNFHQSDLSRFEDMMGRDWRLYTTASENLARLASRCEASCAIKLIEVAKGSKKSIYWYLRSLLGRRVKWWNDVYEAKLSQ